MRKVYLDTNIISIFIRRNIHDRRQLQSILRIVSFWRQGFLDCYTSEDVKKEIEKIPDKYKEQRDASADIWMLLDKSQNFVEKTSRAGWGVVKWGEAAWGGGVEDVDPVYQKIASIFPDIEDQRHIYLAIQNKIEYFITFDKKTILSKIKVHEKELQELGITILSPLEFEDMLEQS